MALRPRTYGGGLVGAYSPGRPAETRAPDSWPDKPLPPSGDIRSSLGGGYSPHIKDRRAVSLPGFNFPPEGSFPVDETSDVAVAPGATATIITVAVPAGVMFRINGIGFDSFDPIALSFLTWSLLRSGDPDRAYTNQAAVIGSVRTPSPIVFFVANQSVITLRLAVAAASPSTYTYVARLHGWFYSEQTG